VRVLLPINGQWLSVLLRMKKMTVVFPKNRSGRICSYADFLVGSRCAVVRLARRTKRRVYSIFLYDRLGKRAKRPVAVGKETRMHMILPWLIGMLAAAGLAALGVGLTVVGKPVQTGRR
jgi:hypothetical protein